MSYSTLKNKTQTNKLANSDNLEQLQAILDSLHKVTASSLIDSRLNDYTGPFLLMEKLPEFLTNAVPDLVNERVMCNYLHVASLIDDTTPFVWHTLSPKQFYHLQKWAKGLERSWLDILKDEDYEYISVKTNILEDHVSRAIVLKKLHSVARNKQIAEFMKRKEHLLRVKAHIYRNVEAQAFPSFFGNSSNDTNVLSQIVGKVKNFFNVIISAPVMAVNFAISVKKLITDLCNTLRGLVKAGRDCISLTTDKFLHVALAIIYLVALYFLESKIAKMVISLITMVVMYSLGNNIVAVLAAIMAGLNITQTSPQIINNVNVNVTGKTVEAHSLDFNPTKLIAFAFALLASFYCPFDNAWKSFLDKCDKIPKAVNGIGKTMEYFEKFFQEHTEDFIERATGYRFSSVNPIPSEVRENCEEVKRLAKMDTFSRMPSDVTICLQIEQVYVEFLRLKTQYYSNRLINEFMNAYQGSVIDLFKKAAAANPRVCSERPRPTCVFFSGTTGVGKSSMMYLLTADILNHFNLFENKSPEEVMKMVNESIYARNAAQEFFDGYQNQLVTVVDDFGCMVDGPSHPNKDFEELLHMVNNFPYPLPMASLSQKANTYFTSKYVFLTSNLKVVNPTSMINPEAIRSRIAYRFDIHVRPEYQVNPDSQAVEDHRIDVNKTREAFGDKMTTDIYEIHVIDPITGRDVDVLSYDQMLERILVHQNKERCFFDKKQESIMQHIQRNRREAQAFFGLFDRRAPASYPSDWFRHHYTKQDDYYYFNFDTIDEVCNLFPGNNTWKDLVYEHKVVGEKHALVRNFYEAYTGLDTNMNAMIRYMKETRDDIKDVDPVELEQIFRNPDWINMLLQVKMKAWEVLYDHISDPLWMAFTTTSIVIMLFAAFDAYREFQRIQEEHHFRDTVACNIEEEDLEAYWAAHEAESGKDKKNVLRRAMEGNIPAESGKTKQNIKTRNIEGDMSLHTEQGRANRLSSIGKPTVIPESFTSTQSREVSCIVRQHFRDLLWEHNGEKLSLAHVVGLRGHWCMINAHYITLFREYGITNEDVLILASPGHTEGVQIPASCIYNGREITRAGEQADMWAFKTPKSVNMFPDLTKHMHTRAMMNDLAEGTSSLLVVPGKDFIMHSCHLIRKVSETLEMNHNGTYLRSVKCMTYEFDARTVKGDCGSLYVVDTNNIKSKVVGLHFAGQPTGGACAIPLVQEDFKFVSDEYEVIPPSCVTVDPQNCVFPIELNGIIPVGNAKPVHSSITSAMEKTFIFGEVQETTVLPAKLGRLLDVNGSGMKAIKKVLPTTPYIPEDEIVMARESFCEMLWKGHPTTKRVFTKMEAVTGLIEEEEKYIRAINRSTSSGYPWMLSNSNGKKNMFNYNEKTTEWKILPKGQEVFDCIDEKLNAMKQGTYTSSIYVDTLKDETRPIEKVLAGKTRLFSAAPVDFVILFRMFFLAFLNWVMVNKIDNEVAVGICAQSVEWNKLARHLLRRGNNVVAGDFTNYDGTLNTQLLHTALDIINDWYDDEHTLTRTMIFEDIVHSAHIAENNVYYWTHSLPSGNPATAVLNSMYNSLACRVAYNRLTKGTAYYGKFNKYVSMVSYGDDNLLSLDTEILDIVNQQTLTEAFASFGMTYTDETKSNTDLPYKKLEECGFLKRGFRFDKDIKVWLGPLQQNSINERLNWQHKHPDARSITILNAEGAIAEWALHDQDQFEFWARKIQGILKAKGVFIPVYSRSYYTTQILDGIYNVSFPQLEFASKVIPQLLAKNCDANTNKITMDNLVTEQKQPTTTQTNLNENPTNPTLIGNSQTEVSDTIRMTHEGETVKHIGRMSDETRVQIATASDPRFHQIKSFLERPHKLDYVKHWGVSEPYNQMCYVPIQTEIAKMLSTLKLEGFYGFSGKCRLRVLVNSQPFQTGVLQVAYWPKYEYHPNEPKKYERKAGFNVEFMQDEALARCESGCPNVLLNIGSTSTCEMVVPYVGSTALMDLNQNSPFHNFGRFIFRALMPLRDATNSPECGISAYISFEDITVYATTPLTATVEAQSGVPQVVEAKQKGKISNIFNTVGRVSSALTSVPGLSSIAGPVSWLADTVSKVSSSFGFSKPHSTEPSCPVWINPVKDFPLCEGVDHSTKMTVTPKSEIEVRPLGETNEDEMAISHIVTKPMFFRAFQWRKDDQIGKLLQVLPVNPSSLNQKIEIKGVTDETRYDVHSHTFLSYLANLFQFWMGTIRFTFTIAGNKFYSGRLRFTYVPNVKEGSEGHHADEIYKKMQHTYTHIVDIRDADTFTVDCSYVSLTPWRQLLGKYNEKLEEGFLYVFVEQELRHPDTVSPNLGIIVHVSGLEDLTFAGPTRPRAAPANGYDFDARHFPRTVEAQGFTLPLSDQHAPANIPIVNDVTPANPLEAHKTSIGDPVTSLRQLLKRFIINDVVLWSTPLMLLQPFKLLDVQDDSRTTINDFVPADYIDFISSMYRFRKGGVRVALCGFKDRVLAAHRNFDALEHGNKDYFYATKSLNREHTRPSIVRQIDTDKEQFRREGLFATAYSFVPHDERNQSILQLEVPYYHPLSLMENNRYRYVLDSKDAEKIDMKMVRTSHDFDITTSNVVTIWRDNQEPTNVEVYRAAADDFNCGFLVGPPPTVTYDVW